MSKHLREQLRMHAQRIIRDVDEDVPDCILACQVRLLIDAATADFGEELYLEIGKVAKMNARQRHALCQDCETGVPIRLSHPPLCGQCDAKQAAEAERTYQEMRKEKPC